MICDSERRHRIITFYPAMATATNATTEIIWKETAREKKSSDKNNICAVIVCTKHKF